MAIRTLIVSETRFMREALGHAITARHHIEVLATVSSTAATTAVHEHRPDVALLHLDIPAGPDLARAISRTSPRTALTAIGVEEEDRFVLPWAEAGVTGYVPPQMSLDQLAECVRMVAEKGAACTPATAAILLRRVSRGALAEPDSSGLTAREGEIAELVAAGLSNKEIARSLAISLPTVKNHVHNILHKLEVDRRYLVGRELRQLPRQPSARAVPDAEALERIAD